MRCLFAILALAAPGLAQQQTLRAANRSFVLGNETSAHYLRSVTYSPTSWGEDGRLWNKTAWGGWLTLWERDLALMREVGLNAVRLHSFFVNAIDAEMRTSFLNAAHAHNISVLLTYDMSGLWLGDPQNVGWAQLALREFLDGLGSHPALALVFLGAPPHP